MGQIRESFKMKIPFVLADRYFPEIKSSQVVMDNFRATWDVVTRMAGAGSQECHTFFYGVHKRSC